MAAMGTSLSVEMDRGRMRSTGSTMPSRARIVSLMCDDISTPSSPTSTIPATGTTVSSVAEASMASR